MKKMTIPAIIALLVIVVIGCTKVKNLANINVDIPYSMNITIPKLEGDTSMPTRLSAGINLPTIAVPTNSKQYLEQYHTNSSNIRQVDLKSLNLQIVAPPGENFDFIDTVQLYLSAPSQPEIIVAYQYNIPKGSNTLDFVTMPDLNLKEYFLADTMYLRMRTYVNAVPATGTELKVSSIFHMLANPLY